MPGITGCSLDGTGGAAITATAAEILAAMERELYPAAGLRRAAGTAGGGFACAVYARRAGAGVIARGDLWELRERRECRERGGRGESGEWAGRDDHNERNERGAPGDPVERRGACLAFDGYVVDEGAPRGAALPAWLLDGFLAGGPAFLERLNGSFQIAVHHRGSTWLFADPTASRRLFYTAGERSLLFSPEIAPLAGVRRVHQECRDGRGSRGEGIDRANLVQFLVSGRFFAGQTLLPWVRQLLPGESVRWQDGRLERRRHFLYQVAPGAPGAPGEPGEPGEHRDRRGLVEELGDLLERATLRAWEQMDDPVIPLSGGYDSRTLFHTVARRARHARHADVRRALSTVLWGQRMDEPGTDNATAREVARRAGARHLDLPWRTDLLAEQFDEMFRAQSGMTDLVYTHSDELEVFRTLAARGFRSALRGDECFGPKGAEVGSVPEALGRISMGRAAEVPESGRWLLGGEDDDRGGGGWLAAHDAALDTLLAEAPASPGELRDTLYGRERLPSYLHHHGYHKLHFLETASPFLDAEVLRFWSALPARCRLDKALVKESYHARFGDHLAVPIAGKDNGPDWPGGLRGSPALAAWVRQRLASLPEPLNRGYFLGKLDALLQGCPEPAAARAHHRVPALKLVARAVVLGRWLENFGS